jgi:hypothetical protein
VGSTTGSEAKAQLRALLEADGRVGDVPDMRARIAAVEAEFGAVREALLAERASR